MEIALWIVQAVLAVKLLTAAISHTLGQSRLVVQSAAAKMGAGARPMLGASGVLMLAGALGLVLPGLPGGDERITALAATAMAVALLGSIPFHLRSRETPNVYVSVILAALAVFVAVGRWGG